MYKVGYNTRIQVEGCVYCILFDLYISVNNEFVYFSFIEEDMNFYLSIFN